MCLLASLAVTPPVFAQDEGSELMRKGLELFFEGLQDELSPALREFSDLAVEAGPALREFLQEMGPAFGEVLAEIKDWSAYHPPEILPNGDIIIRRKTPVAPEPEAIEPDTDGQIEL